MISDELAVGDVVWLTDGIYTRSIFRSLGPYRITRIATEVTGVYVYEFAVFLASVYEPGQIITRDRYVPYAYPAYIDRKDAFLTAACTAIDQVEAVATTQKGAV